MYTTLMYAQSDLISFFFLERAAITDASTVSARIPLFLSVAQSFILKIRHNIFTRLISYSVCLLQLYLTLVHLSFFFHKQALDNTSAMDITSELLLVLSLCFYIIRFNGTYRGWAFARLLILVVCLEPDKASVDAYCISILFGTMISLTS